MAEFNSNLPINDHRSLKTQTIAEGRMTEQDFTEHETMKKLVAHLSTQVSDYYEPFFWNQGFIGEYVLQAAREIVEIAEERQKRLALLNAKEAKQ